jgi:hypothetical protein
MLGIYALVSSSCTITDYSNPSEKNSLMEIPLALIILISVPNRISSPRSYLPYCALEISFS